MINRAAVVVFGKEPLVNWINEIDEEMEITLDEVLDESTVYLISDDDAEEFDAWLDKNYLMIFENELQGWFTDMDLWPEERSIELFYEWFTVSLHTVVEDTVGTPIEDEELEEDEYDYDEDFDFDEDDDEEYEYEEVE